MPHRDFKLSAREINHVLKDVQSGNKDSLLNILQTYPNLHWTQILYDKTGDTVLHCASRLGYVNIIEYILSNFNPTSVDCKNKDDKTSLHEAAQFSQYEACKILLDYGANVNALKRADWTPVMLACTKTGGSSLQTVTLLLENGAIVNYRNKDGWTALHLISREGDVTILNLLLNYGLDVMLKTKNGRAALHIAALHGSIDIVRKLLNLGLNVNERDGCGSTPLHEAVLGGNISICKMLIQNSADIYSTNNSDYGLLHLAASEGHLDVIEFILNELKFDVNQVNEDGLTALHCAARKRQKDTYEYLIKNGASVNVRDKFCRLPLDYF